MIKYLPDPFKTKEDAKRFYESAIDEIKKRFLEPLGLDIWTMYEIVIREIRELESGPGAIYRVRRRERVRNRDVHRGPCTVLLKPRFCVLPTEIRGVVPDRGQVGFPVHLPFDASTDTGGPGAVECGDVM